MHNIKKCRVNPISFLVVSLFSAAAVSAGGEATNQNSDLTLNEDQQCLICQLSGSASLAYDSNLYDKDDYRSVRNLSWNGTLNYPVSEQLRAYITGGGYRVFQDKTGTYVTDTVVGLNYSNLFTFGETGRLGLGGQLTIPTSETSRDTELYTAFRLSMPVSFKMLGGHYSVSPRLRKNFYKYQTMNGRVLTEWVYSVSADVNYQFDKLTLGMSLLGGNGTSYKGNRSREFTYAASVYSNYQISDSWSASFTVSSAGFYSDAERGTLGNLDLFDTDKASYIAQLTYSF
ncbi:hypothetical protein [Vibrio tarriae]|uniref:Outer membrane receptor protein n=1 Tax=Vibrio tarriae TaxID=2014742 RepID=A0AAU8WE12_9VIBR|nr:hypothetical protein [Vibrio tarriae]QEO45691.1 hypothetical protein F0315_10480 [Vibrio cholerae]ASK55008.1 hypothetical protein CEQ48_09465 [Vibrio tarriae]RBM29810.1 hypothetical protein DLR61_08275 [Vibrio tarriae]RBM33090.1 hypothetical protein DLR58_13140 [Vibrio tarriae]RBM38177.1 hypothetical protein DLR63_11030 [Vibrio tarriae]